VTGASVRATLKRLDPYRWSRTFARLFDACFPTYRYVPESQGIQMMAARGRIRDGSARTRRFAGAWDIGQDRYWSICQNELGADGSTLTAEINAHWQVDSGMLPVLYDTTNTPFPSQLLQQLLDRDAVADASAPSLVLAAITLDDTYDPTAPVTLDNASAVEVCNLCIETKQVDHVLDLRSSSGRETLQRMVAEIRGTGVESIPETFIALVPTLVSPRVGGDQFHTALGRELRAKGYLGLIFPSARRDCVAFTTEIGERHEVGWMLLDYQGSGPVEQQDLEGPYSWLSAEDVGIQVIDITRVGSARGEFRASGFVVTGAEASEQAIALARLEAFVNGTDSGSGLTGPARRRHAHMVTPHPPRR
jgi:hypothetical protein